MSTDSNFLKITINAGSTFAAVCAYHPFRTGASRVMAGMPLVINPVQLYAGFVPSVAGSHQLFIMSSVYQAMSSKYSTFVAAVFAGLASTPTTTYCDVLTIRKQTAISLPINSINMALRGLIPTAFRQIGLTFGCFVFPSWIERKLSTNSPFSKTEMPKAFYSFIGGATGAVLTHYPDTCRVVMQSNPHMAMYETCSIAFSRMMSPSGANSCFMRIAVLGIASSVMHQVKACFSNVLNEVKE